MGKGRKGGRHACMCTYMYVFIFIKHQEKYIDTSVLTKQKLCMSDNFLGQVQGKIVMSEKRQN